MNLKTAVGTLLLTGVATFAPAQSAGTTMVSAPGKVMVKDEMTISATVTAIKAKERILTLKTVDGQVEDIVVGSEVRNFDQIKVGDLVKAKAFQSLTLELLKGGAGNPVRMEGADAARTKTGEKPGAMAAEKVVILADVVAVDRAAKTIDVKGPQRSMTLVISDPSQFAMIEVGDRIKGTFEVAVAVAVVTEHPKK
jgi:hypothetical protein